MQFWCLLVIHFNLKFFVYRHHVPTKIARPECVDNRLAAAADGSTSSELRVDAASPSAERLLPQ